MKATQVIETCLYVDDLGRAEAFYDRVLGLEKISSVDGRHVFFRCGPGVLLLFNPAQTAQPTSGVPTHGAHGPGHVAFATHADELAAWRDHLNAHGVEVEAEVAWPQGAKSLYFRDPAGNSLELVTPTVWNNKEP